MMDQNPKPTRSAPLAHNDPQGDHISLDDMMLWRATASPSSTDPLATEDVMLLAAYIDRTLPPEELPRVEALVYNSSTARELLTEFRLESEAAEPTQDWAGHDANPIQINTYISSVFKWSTAVAAAIGLFLLGLQFGTNTGGVLQQQISVNNQLTSEMTFGYLVDNPEPDVDQLFELTAFTAEDES